jgi:cobalt/nickel transport system permease protein
VSGVHAHALHFHGHSAVHRLAPHVKIVALFAYVGAVVLTPTRSVWAFGLQAAVLVYAIGMAELPTGFFLRRLSIEIPFVIFALAMPFVGEGPYVEIGPLVLSETGLWGAWNVLAKATLSVGASIVLTATTEVPDLLAGFERLRAPRLLTAIAGFMVRYVELVGAELGRVRTAVAARLGDRRRLGEAATLATVSGTMFIRSYERGERVHQAMLARGYDGTMPAPVGSPVRVSWSGVAAWAAVAWAVAVTAMVMA